MKVKGNEKILLDEEDILDEKSNDASKNYNGGVLKIKTAIGKMRKQEDSPYKKHDSKNFKK